MPNNLFVDDLDMPIKVDYDMKTREEAKVYYDRLCNVLGEKYPLHYYEVISDEKYNLDYKAHNDLEKIIKITLLDEKETQIFEEVIDEFYNKEIFNDKDIIDIYEEEKTKDIDDFSL